jgi:hypothetical protein
MVGVDTRMRRLRTQEGEFLVFSIETMDIFIRDSNVINHTQKVN